MKKLLVLMIAAALTGCATSNPRPQLIGPEYNTYESRNAVDVTLVRVENWRYVIGKSAPKTTAAGTAVAAGLGGAVGAAVGSSIGKKGSTTNKVATGLGAVAGAGVGLTVQNEIAEQESRKQQIEINVILSNGNRKSVIQDISSEKFFPGQLCAMTMQRGGWHVSPYN